MSESADSLPVLLGLVQKGIDDNDLELSERYLKQAFEAYPTRWEVYESQAHWLLEMDRWEEALSCLLKAVELAPNKMCPSVHMTLAQMTTELEAVKHYQLGIEQYISQANGLDENSVEMNELKRKVSDGFVAMTELYLTDLCFEPDAESRCESQLTKALEIDPNNPMIYQTLASVRLSQHRIEEARQALLTSMNLWYNKPEVTPPVFLTRLALARLMIEAELFDEVYNVLEHLQKEDDKVVEVYYLFGLTSYLLGNQGFEKNNVNENMDMKEQSFEYFKDAWECFLMARKLAAEQNYDDADVMNHIENIGQDMIQQFPELSNYDPENEEPINHADELEAYNTDDEME